MMIIKTAPGRSHSRSHLHIKAFDDKPTIQKRTTSSDELQIQRWSIKQWANIHTKQSDNNGWKKRRMPGLGWKKCKSVKTGVRVVCHWMTSVAKKKFSIQRAAFKFEDLRKKFHYNKAQSRNKYLKVSAGSHLQLLTIHSGIGVTNKASTRDSQEISSIETNLAIPRDQYAPSSPSAKFSVEPGTKSTGKYKINNTFCMHATFISEKKGPSILHERPPNMEEEDMLKFVTPRKRTKNKKPTTFDGDNNDSSGSDSCSHSSSDSDNDDAGLFYFNVKENHVRMLTPANDDDYSRFSEDDGGWTPVSTRFLPKKMTKKKIKKENAKPFQCHNSNFVMLCPKPTCISRVSMYDFISPDTSAKKGKLLSPVTGRYLPVRQLQHPWHRELIIHCNSTVINRARQVNSYHSSRTNHQANRTDQFDSDLKTFEGDHQVDEIESCIDIKGVRTFKIRIEDDDGQVYPIRVPNSIYVPFLKKVLLAPHHQAQATHDITSNPRGTRMATYGNCIILYWDQGKDKQTLEMSKSTNNPTVRNASGTKNYLAYSKTIEALKACTSSKKGEQFLQRSIQHELLTDSDEYIADDNPLFKYHHDEKGVEQVSENDQTVWACNTVSNASNEVTNMHKIGRTEPLTFDNCQESSQSRYKLRFKKTVVDIKGTLQQIWSKGEGKLDEDLHQCTWISRMTDNQQNNNESEGILGYRKNVSYHSQHWKRESELDGDLYASYVSIYEDGQSVQKSFEIQVQIIEQSFVCYCFIHISFLDRIYGDSQLAQNVFAIQVRIIGPPSSMFAIQVRIIGSFLADVVKNVLFTNKAIHIPETISKVDKSMTPLLQTPFMLDIGQYVLVNDQLVFQALLKEMTRPPSLRLIQESIVAQTASTFLRELNNCSFGDHLQSSSIVHIAMNSNRLT
jgi:hypothetical protein